MFLRPNASIRQTDERYRLMRFGGAGSWWWQRTSPRPDWGCSGVLRSGAASLDGPSELEGRLKLPHSRLHCFSEGSGMMKRRAVVLLLTLLALVAAAPGALAAKPTHERLPIDDEFVDDRSFR
jgi:hypothetical protein